MKRMRLSLLLWLCLAFPVAILPASQSLTQTSGTHSAAQHKAKKNGKQGTGAPEGATAQCRDGTYSFSAHRRGTCSHHGGVSQWL